MLYKVQLLWEPKSLLPKDWYCTTFHVDADSFDDDTLTEFVDCLDDWYNVPAGTSMSLATMSSNAHLTGNAALKVYNMGDVKPQHPILRGYVTGLFRAGTVEGMPLDVQLVVGWAKRAVSGEIPARMRNYIYLPCLARDICVNLRPTAPAVLGLLESTVKLHQDVRDSATMNYLVAYSGTNQSAVIPNYCWADNKWDTQRRRDIDATQQLQRPI